MSVIFQRVLPLVVTVLTGVTLLPYPLVFGKGFLGAYRQEQVQGAIGVIMLAAQGFDVFQRGINILL